MNSVTIGADTAVYSVSKSSLKVQRLLLTHARRNAIGAVPPGIVVIVPTAEKDLFTQPEKFWSALETKRFHDYAQVSTKVPVLPLKNVQIVADEAAIPTKVGTTIKAVSSPGYTPGAMSYVIDSGGRRLICTGDLIYGYGQILDLYSLQDAVPEANARGYHGYVARAGELIAKSSQNCSTEAGRSSTCPWSSH